MRRALLIPLACMAIASAADAGVIGTVDEPAEAARLWRQMRAARADTAQYKAAQWKLTALLGTMPKSRRAAAAAAMMDRHAAEGVNVTALGQFGADPLPVTDVQKILWDSQRSPAEALLLKTYYSFCRDSTEKNLTEATRRQLVAILAERMTTLAGSKAGYREQRMLTGVCSAALSRYARAADVPQVGQLVKAMEAYAEKADASDGLAAAIPVWLDLRQVTETKIATFSRAVRCLGHWDPLMRWQAAAHLGSEVDADERAARVVQALFADPRDEARAAAMRVFAFARTYRPDVIIPAMIGALTTDRSVAVQAAAAEVLVARADQAVNQVEPLLAPFERAALRPGSKRGSSILTVVARLAGEAADAQKKRILAVAIRRLDPPPRGVISAPGALAVLVALGPAAAEALPAVRKYRASADRIQGSYIDRTVIPAIEAGSSGS
jgi:hypothetical protein